MKSLVNFAALLLVVMTAACSGTSTPGDVSTSAEPQADANNGNRNKNSQLQGYKVYRDPETGELLSAPPEQGPAVQNDTSEQNAEPAAEPEIPIGSVKLPDGRIVKPVKTFDMKATKGPNGELIITDEESAEKNSN